MDAKDKSHTIGEDDINNQLKNLNMGDNSNKGSDSFLEENSMSDGSGLNKGVIMEEPDFKFVLYASFMSREESVGLPLCEMLRKINTIAGLNTFELNLRFSIDEKGNRIKGQSRWD